MSSSASSDPGDNQQQTAQHLNPSAGLIGIAGQNLHPNQSALLIQNGQQQQSQLQQPQSQAPPPSAVANGAPFLINHQQQSSNIMMNDNTNGSNQTTSTALNAHINNNNNHNNQQQQQQQQQSSSMPSSDNNNQQPSTGTRPASVPVVALDRQRLQELVQQVDPNEQLEEEVEDVLLSLADDFIESLVSQACMIAKHRKSNSLDVKDVLLALDINWNMWIPGFGVDGVVGVFSGTQSSGGGQSQSQQQGNAGGQTMMNRAPKKCLTTEAHKQRLALIKKVMKKF